MRIYPDGNGQEDAPNGGGQNEALSGDGGEGTRKVSEEEMEEKDLSGYSFEAVETKKSKWQMFKVTCGTHFFFSAKKHV